MPAGKGIRSAKADYGQIARLPLILPSAEGLGLYHALLEKFTRRKLTPHIVCECSDIAMLMRLVASGFGASLVPKTVLQLHQGHEVTAFEVDDSHDSMSLGLIWLKHQELSAAAQRFVDYLSEHYDISGG
ncbi:MULTISPECIES: LysR family transcriptional regulator substrate-binding protein [Paenibacillus]|uniref:LysR family transcriptional regulator substrate-binding protein n=1 Tax=Paenibacillus TaxID=44249 RepID=UPI0022B93D41|nr:LysR family transcriptional regulator substrate-binding protein [Paenibacillus caseinilyticus]MCZ8521921.1 LysR family transcriptional regulator substrate-binding protein [Paenibacillus caseinilyticus]